MNPGPVPLACRVVDLFFQKDLSLYLRASAGVPEIHNFMCSFEYLSPFSICETGFSQSVDRRDEMGLKDGKAVVAPESEAEERGHE